MNTPRMESSETLFTPLADARGTFVRPVEAATLIYLTLTAGIFLVFRRNLPAWGYHVAAHMAAAALVFLLAWVQRTRTRGVLRFVRLWSPLLIFIGCFEEIERVVHVLFPGW